MISTESFSKEWIVLRSEELGYNNKQLLEKVIRAFALLEMLVDAGAPVIFKGGSSLLLILKDTLNRLSISIGSVSLSVSGSPDWGRQLSRLGQI